MVEPALDRDEWAFLQPTPTLIVTEDEGLCAFPRPDAMRVAANGIDVYDDPAAIIAVANAMLPDGDPRKITRHTVRFLRRLAEANWLADALESYLPPE